MERLTSHTARVIHNCPPLTYAAMKFPVAFVDSYTGEVEAIAYNAAEYDAACDYLGAAYRARYSVRPATGMDIAALEGVVVGDYFEEA